MVRISIITFILMHALTALIAQEGAVYSIEWKIGGKIPANPGQSKTLGLAGAIIGKINKLLVVAGGCNFPDSMPWLGGKKKYYQDVFVFTKNRTGSFEIHGTAKLPFTLAYAASCNTDHGIVFAGGENENDISKKVYLLQWDEVNKKVNLQSLPDLPLPLTNAAAVAAGDKVYIGGGESIGRVSNRLLVLDMKKPLQGWRRLSNLPKSLSHSVMVLQNDGKKDCIYVIGGRRKRVDSTSQLYASNFKYDLHSNKWSEKKTLPYEMSAGTGIAHQSHHIVLIGGDVGKTFHQTEELILAINKEHDEQRRSQLNVEKMKLQSAHPGFSKKVLLYDTIADQWTALEPVPFEVPVTTIAVKWDNSIVIPGGEIKAGVRSANILVGDAKAISKK